MLRLFLALLIAASGCSPLSSGSESGGSEIPPEPDVVFLSGVSFGHCLGYCREELTVRGRAATLIYVAQGVDGLFDIRHDRTLSDDEWLAVEVAFDRDALAGADEVYGCPDCADGGAEWVGAIVAGEEKRVTFEALDTVDGLEPFIEAMRALQASFPPAPRP